MSRPTGGCNKRPALFVPEGIARDTLMSLSKADLAELVWDFAVLSVGDEAATDSEPSLALRVVAQHNMAISRATGMADPHRALGDFRAMNTAAAIAIAKAEGGAK